MSTPLNIGKDINGAICDTIGVAADKRAATLTANTAQSVIVPPNVNSAFFSFGSSGDVWVSIDSTASLPGGIFSPTNSELNPKSRYVLPGQNISCVCSVTNAVQISFYNTLK